ncbi:hypothetical protein KKE78_01475 [Patescibacteria group bacterium]|nr:hypothetical protein [Patescibacteria group bacterium]
MTKETEAIFSSTGRLGVSRRPYDRIYVNGIYSSDPNEFEENFQRLIAIGRRHQRKSSRNLFRGLVSETVMQHISTNGLNSYLEVALPVNEFIDDNSWFVYLADNSPGRELIVPREVMMKAVSKQREEIISPIERIRSVLQQGYTFIDRIHEDQVNQVYSLWGETFGWKRYQVDNLRRRLDANQYDSRSRRDVWFAAIKYDRTIIGAAMAELLSIPAAYGQLDLVESTEWRTRDGYTGNGFMTATVAVLNAQILSDLQRRRNNISPLIYAECNFQSRSDRVGHGAGFCIPERTNAPQILVQNALVRDGQLVEEGKLRDFTFMYLSIEAMHEHYDFMQTEAIKQLAI